MSSGVVLGRFILRPVRSISCVGRREISGKALRDPTYKRPKPWPYADKKFTFFDAFFLRESTTARMDENSKVVVVEGPVASGTSTVAKKLAEDLDMLYVPDGHLDMYYINSYGFDTRTLDPEVPESCRSFDIKHFHQDPKNRKVAMMQCLMYKMRYMQYMKALAHLMSTGQGVVLDRSCYSDLVFAEAMFKNEYISKNALDMYYRFRDNTITQLLRPHLVVYLDVPVPVTLQNIKKRARPDEKDSKALTEKFLTDAQDAMKNIYLKDISSHAELLVYDWSSHGDVEVVVEDIERLDFDNYETEDTKLRDWRDLANEWDWHKYRQLYADKRDWLETFFNVPIHTAPELLIDGDDAWVYHNAIDNAPGNKFEKGYNADQGDKGIWLK
ncbi:NADH dehydrogenase [ubiquinone] 1 alpha subcomplex subunit 10, mitochondrial [Neocloeon triangulifer]|uniref:NADH dehydrogenase [ubiquinone] 1 alpha subcomplex subunit 10, mitochondrial n=1 Tax=Neocloeon triangulifer TaxID=2078957 RepID=UPI00286F8AD6|nr:NADH dehydrogenase [ubiquinone] 1 alpha subcomplex subunit 10, mitochondrial [Neocloeon triangulifer]